jgi:hypothetical protein
VAIRSAAVAMTATAAGTRHLSPWAERRERGKSARERGREEIQKDTRVSPFADVRLI